MSKLDTYPRTLDTYHAWRIARFKGGKEFTSVTSIGAASLSEARATFRRMSRRDGPNVRYRSIYKVPNSTYTVTLELLD